MTLDEENTAKANKVLAAIRAGAHHTDPRDIGELLNGKWDQDFVTWLLAQPNELRTINRTHAAELAALEKATIERCAYLARTVFDVDGNDGDIAIAQWNAAQRIGDAISALPREHKDGE